jgi:zinc protease
VAGATPVFVPLREQDGFSYGTWGGMFPGDLDPVGAVAMGAILAPQNLPKGKAAIQEEVARLLTDGVTADEVAVARKAWIDQDDNGLSDDGSLVGVLRNDRFLGRDFGWHQAFRDRLAKVTADDVNRVLKTYLQPGKLIFLQAGDLSKIGSK